MSHGQKRLYVPMCHYKKIVSHYLNFLHNIAPCLKSSKHDGPSLTILVPSTRGICDLALKKG